LLIADSPSKINAQIVLESLQDLSELYETFQPAEKAKYLQRLIRDIVINEDEITINI
jgi:hypothetical protein